MNEEAVYMNKEAWTRTRETFGAQTEACRDDIFGHGFSSYRSPGTKDVRWRIKFRAAWINGPARGSLSRSSKGPSPK